MPQRELVGENAVTTGQAFSQRVYGVIRIAMNLFNAREHRVPHARRWPERIFIARKRHELRDAEITRNEC